MPTLARRYGTLIGFAIILGFFSVMLPETFLTGLAVWVPYYGGQLLICVGAVGAIEHWRDTAARERVTVG